MPTCAHCGGEFEAAELRRHERRGVVVVHCPNCDHAMGRYNRHAR